MKLISSCKAPKTLNASNMDTLIECQSEGDIKDHPLLASSCESEDSICQLTEIKKRKKVLSWPFLVRRLSTLSDFSGTSDTELKTSLFDQPLSIICSDDDKLPRPLQDILTILCLKGPSTEGIFRKAANEKARKELKEELNSGGRVDLDSLPVHLLAVVFKDFLRGIPLKLLSCDLFDEWMGALEKQSEEDKIEALKQVADKLPRPNRLLLKNLVSVLYLISKNAEVSKMDASNLAICVGPNMLARENDQTLSFEAQKDLNNKVKTLVEFLIDNCLEIFGENIPAHSSIASEDSLDHTDSSDTSTLQHDSAYDSNDPDVESPSAVSSPSPLPPKPSETAAGLEPRGPRDAWQLRPVPIASTVARLKGALSDPDRRYSEPSMASSHEYLQSQRTRPKLTRSEDDFTRARPGSRPASEDAEDPFPEEVFPAADGRDPRPQDPQGQSWTQGLVPPWGPAPTAASHGPRDASCDSWPRASPCSAPRELLTRHQSFMGTDKSKPSRELKKHMSFSFSSPKKVLSKTPGVLPTTARGFPRGHARKDLQRDSQLAGRLVQDPWSDPHGPPALGFSSSASRLPSYEEATGRQARVLAASGSHTVGSMRARVLSLGTGPPLQPPFHHDADPRTVCRPGPPDGHRLPPWTEESRTQSRTVQAPVETIGQVTVMGRPELPRLRTVSESRQRSTCGYLGRRCSQPVFEAEALQYAKESYI